MSNHTRTGSRRPANLAQYDNRRSRRESARVPRSRYQDKYRMRSTRMKVGMCILIFTLGILMIASMIPATMSL